MANPKVDHEQGTVVCTADLWQASVKVGRIYLKWVGRRHYRGHAYLIAVLTGLTEQGVLAGRLGRGISCMLNGVNDTVTTSFFVGKEGDWAMWGVRALRIECAWIGRACA